MWSVHRGGREVSSCGRGVRHGRGPNNNLIRQPRTTTDKNDSRNLSTHDYRSWNVKMCAMLLWPFGCAPRQRVAQN
ncbi:hypothetical protein GW17_00012003 [Ensete ventricosum]|nr:hypothetical protein GW17_00012003 [Ensete ventricosum]